MSKGYAGRKTLCATPGCGQPTSKQAFVCRGCVAVLERDLGAVPALVEELLTSLSRQDALTPSGRMSDTGGLPFKPRAAEGLFVLTNVVSTWCRVFVEHYGLRVTEEVQRATAGVTAPAAITAAAARWLLRHVRSVAMHPAAGEAVDEIGDAVREAYHVIDRPAELMPAGQCGYLDCASTLYAAPDAAFVRCKACGASHDAALRRAWMRDASAEHLLLASTALSWVKLLEGKSIPAGTMRSWLSRGQIHHAGVDHLGRRLYRFGDVRGLAREWEARPRRALKRPAA